MTLHIKRNKIFAPGQSLGGQTSGPFLIAQRNVVMFKSEVIEGLELMFTLFGGVC